MPHLYKYKKRAQNTRETDHKCTYNNTCICAFLPFHISIPISICKSYLQNPHSISQNTIKKRQLIVENRCKAEKNATQTSEIPVTFIKQHNMD